MEQTGDLKFPSIEEMVAEYVFLRGAADVFVRGLTGVIDILTANKLITKCKELQEHPDPMVKFNGLFFARFAVKSIKKIADGKRAEVLKDWEKQRDVTYAAIFEDIDLHELKEAVGQDFQTFHF